MAAFSQLTGRLVIQNMEINDTMSKLNNIENYSYKNGESTFTADVQGGKFTV